MLYEFKRKQEEQRIREMVCLQICLHKYLILANFFCNKIILKEEKKARDAEAKRKRLEEAEKKRAAMQAAMNKQQNAENAGQRNFVIQKRSDGGPGAALGSSGFDRVRHYKTLGFDARQND